jgi:hypothetical protein
MSDKFKICKIESRYDLDPDFGDLQPDIADAYMISVTPKTASSRYNFITLLPEMESVEDTYSLLSKVMTEFLNEGDRYTVRDFDDRHAEDFISKGSHAPIISFDPDSLDGDLISFLWLVPPKFLMQ